ncbi:uncharacterized protein M421DRAFT_296486 [Didymella exigua CBS 183.55]|uniref:Uncharacterized protein n=1 Tax=Didymella exigua CBS 183.55 TaxID=1150837 RepID=A0A6A5RA33_9PLEO|nr:uncharacterized protein M421DRAFT_296486 [Didymella exigua CBS 183.55]KAF1924189.1 hypothetical protein M421DRAFT_296486 [Didymella exigua CBS 183.55]
MGVLEDVSMRLWWWEWRRGAEASRRLGGRRGDWASERLLSNRGPTHSPTVESAPASGPRIAAAAVAAAAAAAKPRRFISREITANPPSSWRIHACRALAGLWQRSGLLEPRILVVLSLSLQSADVGRVRDCWCSPKPR